MSSFPVLTSTLAPGPLAVLIQDKYKIKGPCVCRVFKTGINHTYMVETPDQKFVLRIYSYNWRTEAEITEELRLLLLLKENGISVSYPIPDQANTYLQPIEAPEGLRYAVLFSFAEGDKIRSLTPSTCWNIGSLMANMHRVTRGQKLDRVAYNSNTLTQLPYLYASEFFEKTMLEMQFVRSTGKFLTSLFEQVDSGQLRTGAVHLDLWYDNMNIKDEATITLFDFDFCGNGWLLLDMAYFSMQLFHTEPDKGQYEIKLKHFMQGYERITPIHEEELRLIPYAGAAIWIFYLGVQSQRFDNWSNIFLTNNYLVRYIGMVKEWLAYNNIKIPTNHTP